jgi:hypothetical protein
MTRDELHKILEARRDAMSQIDQVTWNGDFNEGYNALLSDYLDLYDQAVKLKEDLYQIRCRLEGANHTLLPINVRELDGSISQHRPISSVGEAYNISGKAIKDFDEYIGGLGDI